MNHPFSITIHRGTQQIGGSCVELRYGNTRLIVDAGTELPGIDDSGERSDEMPPLLNVPGLFTDDGTVVKAVLLSHNHGDHSGLLPYIRQGVPVCMSKGTSQMLMISGMFLPQRIRQKKRGEPEQIPALNGETISLGDFRVTPFTVDHSGYDARAFIIEGGGKRIIYSGDLRMHGPQRASMEQMLEHPLWQNPDALIMEGTHLGKPQSGVETEESFVARLTNDLQSTSGLALLMFSPQNVERLRTMIAAAKAADRIFVTDPYTLYVLYCVWRDARMPNPFSRSGNIRVWFPNGRSRDLRRSFLKNLIPKIDAIALTPDDIVQDSARYSMVFRESMTRASEQLLKRATVAIHSLWQGYEQTKKTGDLKKHFEACGVPWLYRHSSGHIHHVDLLAFVRSVQPKNLIPIHTETGDRFAEFLPEIKVKRLADGEELVL